MPPFIALTVTGSTGPICGSDCLGSITIECASTAGPPFTYRLYTDAALTQLVQTVTGQSGAPFTFQKLCAGQRYWIFATDGVLSTANPQLNLQIPYGIILVGSVVVTNALSPGGNEGTVTATVTGTSNNLEYKIGSGAYQSSNFFSGLTAGNYILTAHDKVAGCIIQIPFVVTQPSYLAGLAATVSHTNVLCHGGSTGTATALGNGGSGSYTYKWDDAGMQATATAVGLPIGTYNCLVTDNVTSLTVLVTVVITEPAIAIGLVLDAHNPSSFGANNGWINAMASGGNLVYNYLWSTGATTQIITGLAPGSYTCTVTDIKGCTLARTIVLVQPASVEAPSDYDIKLHNLQCCRGKLAYKVAFGKSIGENEVACEEKLDTLTDLLIILEDYDATNPSNCLTSTEKDLLMAMADEICLQCGCRCS